MMDPAEWPMKEMRPASGSGSASSWQRCLMKLWTSCAKRWPMGSMDPPVLSSFDCGLRTTAPGKSKRANARRRRMSNDDAYQPCCITIKCGPLALECGSTTSSSSKVAGTPGFETAAAFSPSGLGRGTTGGTTFVKEEEEEELSADKDQAAGGGSGGSTVTSSEPSSAKSSSLPESVRSKSWTLLSPGGTVCSRRTYTCDAQTGKSEGSFSKLLSKTANAVRGPSGSLPGAARSSPKMPSSSRGSRGCRIFCTLT
mmetsp:Transcript_4475/g.14020  ORF Transcript_4475/g.14020 Transcript_4475/m.14020 type:complete len:255 (-) Transcript_4475:1054-1818(-)